MMENIIGSSVPVFIGMTLVLFGFAAYSTGKALGTTWKPVSHLVFYVLLLGIGDRFLTFALFEAPLLSLPAYIVDTAVLMLIGLASYKFNRNAKMLSQYPWLYERSGLFGLKERRTQV